MIEFKHNILAALFVAFHVVALSGLTLPIHHTHPIEKSPDGVVVHDETNAKTHSVTNAPSTYHEMHFVKFLSGDSFKNTKQIDFKTSFQKLGFIQVDEFQLSPFVHLSPLANKNLHDTGPPSVDKCVLFCSFLI